MFHRYSEDMYKPRIKMQDRHRHKSEGKTSTYMCTCSISVHVGKHMHGSYSWHLYVTCMPCLKSMHVLVMRSSSTEDQGKQGWTSCCLRPAIKHLQPTSICVEKKGTRPKALMSTRAPVLHVAQETVQGMTEHWGSATQLFLGWYIIRSHLGLDAGFV